MQQNVRSRKVRYLASYFFKVSPQDLMKECLLTK